MTPPPPDLHVVPSQPAVFRLRPVPTLDPPFDDERTEPVRPFVDGSLALAFPPSRHVAVPLRLVPPAGGVDIVVLPSRRDQLPDPRPWTARLAQAIAEVLAGARPAGQLAQVATLDVLALLERGSGRLGSRPGGPAQRPVVGSVHLSEPVEGVAEACAVVDTGVRRRALAFRLEGADGQWRCTALQIG
jgi:Family of unknown function (DUF6459)